MVSGPCFLCFLVLYGCRRRTDRWWGLSIQEPKSSALSRGRGDVTWRGSVKQRGNCYKTYYGAQPLRSHFQVRKEQGFPKGKLCCTEHGHQRLDSGQ